MSPPDPATVVARAIEAELEELVSPGLAGYTAGASLKALEASGYRLVREEDQLTAEETEALDDAVRAGLSHRPPPGGNPTDEACLSCRALLKLARLAAPEREEG